jgi:hypothetical protein
MLPLEWTHPAGSFGPVLRRSGERRRLNIRPEQCKVWRPENAGG